MAENPDISLQNPLGLDFQGYDFKETLQKDKQEKQDKKEYLKQKKYWTRMKFEEKMHEDLNFQQLQKNYGLPDAYNLDKFVDEDVHAPSDEKNMNNDSGNKSFELKSDIEKQSFLFRTPDKTKFKEREDKQLQLKSDKILLRYTASRQKASQTREEEHQKAKVDDELYVRNLGEKDFEDFLKESESTSSIFLETKPQKSKIKTKNISPNRAPILNVVYDNKKTSFVNKPNPKKTSPKCVKIKKFNLTGFLYGKPKHEIYTDDSPKAIKSAGFNKFGIPYEIIKKYDTLLNNKSKKQIEKGNQRMKTIRNKLQIQDEGSLRSSTGESDEISELSSDDSDWIPLSNVKIGLNHFRGSVIPEDGPRVKKIEDDILISPNLNMEKTTYTKIFDARHHHHHYDHTQHKHILVGYRPKMPMTSCEVEKDSNSVTVIPENIESKENLQDCRSTRLKKSSKLTLKARYNQAILQKYHELRRIEKEDEKIMKSNEFLDELNSIMSTCYSSDSSTIVSKSSSDSGSFFMIQGKKVPLDFIRKSNVPFDKVNRCRVKVTPLDSDAFHLNPYYVVPFSGQEKIMKQLCKTKMDNQNKVAIPPKDEEEMIGESGKKFPTFYATEWDAYFQTAIKSRPRVKIFQKSKALEQLREILQKKIVRYMIQEQMTKQKIEQEIIESYFDEFENFKDVCHQFITWHNDEYYRSMKRKQQELEPMYEVSRDLKKTLEESRKDFIKLKLRINHYEDEWRRLTIYQNFNYLITDVNWRAVHDWMHRNVDGSLENYRESIEKRSTSFVRNRETDDVWDIKRYYDNVFCNNRHEVLFPFKNGKELGEEILQFKHRLFVALVNLHAKIWTLFYVNREFNEFMLESTENHETHRNYVEDQCGRLYFMEDRVFECEKKGIHLIDGKLVERISDTESRKLFSLCGNLYECFAPKGLKSGEKSLDLSPTVKITIISDLLIDLLEKIDRFPVKLRKSVELKIRTRRKTEMRFSIRACATEKRIKNIMDGLVRNLAPPYQKPKREGKLPRSYVLKTKTKKSKSAGPVDKKLQFFLDVFTDETVESMDLTKPENRAILNTIEDNFIPFDFDYFLKMHDYVPDYNFKTQIELKDGPEENRFTYKDVIPDVNKTMDAWDTYKRIEKEEFIRRGQFMYQQQKEKKN